MPFLNRVRLPMIFIKPQFPVERNSFRLANGVNKTLSVVVRNTYQGQTDQLPEAWHRKLVIALAHDTVNVENERLLSGVGLDGDYGIDWQDFLQYPIAQASFQVQVTPFDATNSNCQTCEDISQVVCEDDVTDEVWDEGTTHEFPDNLTANDSICCSPYTVTLVTYNTLYFSAVSITPDGILTATVKDPAPNVDDVWVARYRVTCESGAYDEADVYGNITGSEGDICYPPEVAVTTLSSTSVRVDFTPHEPVCPGTIWYWQLFETSNLGVLIEGGNITYPDVDVVLTGLTAGISYSFYFFTDCCGAEDYSVIDSVLFTITSFAASTCGQFTVTYIPYAEAAPQSISYMDCAGGIQNVELTVAQEQVICMLITADTEVPIFYVASSADIVLTYNGLCS